MSAEAPDVIEEVLRSPMLYLGEVRISEQRTRGRASLRSGRNAKDIALPIVAWFLKDAPRSLAVLPLLLITGTARLLYWLPGNPLRQACEYVCTLAKEAGHDHSPRRVYGQFLTNLLEAGKAYQRLFRDGSDAALAHFEMSDASLAMLRESLAGNDGIMVACPHNPASVLSGCAMNKLVPMIAVMKNSATIRRTKLALHAFECMRLQLIMVRSGNPFELSRGMFSALKDGKAIAATVDNVDNSGGGIEVEIFGQKIPFATWAAKIAVKKKVPMIGSYYHSNGSSVRAVFSEPLVTDKLEEAVTHYVKYFEQKILEDPASWAYLADRRWRNAMRRAVQEMGTDPN